VHCTHYSFSLGAFAPKAPKKSAPVSQCHIHLGPCQNTALWMHSSAVREPCSQLMSISTIWKQYAITWLPGRWYSHLL